jgi:hypothetical protein
MGRPTQNLPRAFRQPQPTQATKRSGMTRAMWASVTSLVVIAAAAAATLALLSHNTSQVATEDRIDHQVSTLLAGIPQQERTLGKPAAPVTLEVFLDLKDPDSRNWFLNNLLAIIHSHVRTGALKLEYHAYKTNTFSPQEFVKDQTAALAAGAQNKLWNFSDAMGKYCRLQYEVGIVVMRVSFGARQRTLQAIAVA